MHLASKQHLSCAIILKWSSVVAELVEYFPLIGQGRVSSFGPAPLPLVNALSGSVQGDGDDKETWALNAAYLTQQTLFSVPLLRIKNSGLQDYFEALLAIRVYDHQVGPAITIVQVSHTISSANCILSFG